MANPAFFRLPAAAPARVTGRVLVVDDEAANRELLEEILTSQGHIVHTASDGRTSLQQFENANPDLVLLDVQMPHMNGFDVCRYIKSNPETRLVPVVLVTALSQTEDRVMGIEAGADDFLTKPIERTQLVARVRSLLSLKEFTDELDRAESVLFALARSIEGKDPYTKGHCDRLSLYSSQLAEAIGLSPDEVLALRRAGIVHDVGKVAVPDAILLKPTRLTSSEITIMQQHPVIGEQICAPLKLFKAVLPIIRHHHEKMNGTGYPDGLKGEQIPITARVLQIADVYDALTTHRPYKRALSQLEAFTVMKDEVNKGWWDPVLLDAFKSIHAGAGLVREEAEPRWQRASLIS